MSLLNEVLKDLDSQDAKNPDQELLRQYASPTVAASSGSARTRIKQVAVLMLGVAGVVLLALGVKSWLGGRADPVLPEQPVAKLADTAVPAQGAEDSEATVPGIAKSAKAVPDAVSPAQGNASSSAMELGGTDAPREASETEVRSEANSGVNSVDMDAASETVSVKPVAMLPRFSAGEPVSVKPATSAPKKVVRSESIASPRSAPPPPPPTRVSKPVVSSTSVAAVRDRPSLSSLQPPQAPPMASRSSVLKPSLKRLYELDLAERAEALRLVGVGDLSGAESRLRRFLTANPEAKLSRSTLASVLIQQNRPLEAEQILIGGMAQDEEGMDRVKLLARTHIARKDYDAAKRILDANPVSIDRDPEYHSLRAAVYQRTGDFGAAASTYRQLLNDYPPQPAWWLGLALSLEAAGSRKDAIYAYRQVRDFQGAKPALKAYASERIAAISR